MWRAALQLLRRGSFSPVLQTKYAGFVSQGVCFATDPEMQRGFKGSTISFIRFDSVKLGDDYLHYHMRGKIT